MYRHILVPTVVTRLAANCLAHEVLPGFSHRLDLGEFAASFMQKGGELLHARVHREADR
jgi:hypothetical protein